MLKKCLSFISLFALSAGYTLSVEASPLQLELTQGVSSATPIAIVPFAGQSDSEATNVSAIIQKDLQTSGQFKPIDSTAMPQTPHSVDEVKADVWHKAGTDDVVVGQVKAQGDGSYQVNFGLVDTVKGQTLDQQNFTVPAGELRHLAHHISDQIYQKLTGVRGIFSTKIAYVLAQHSGDMYGTARYTLEVADYDGYGAKPLLTSSQPIMSPAWSHDGSRLAYVSFEQGTPKIFVQNVASGSRHVVSEFAGINGAPAWSKDDSQLAIVLSKDGSPKIYSMSSSGGDLHQLTQGTSIDTEPNWSPDGRSLIFTSDRGGGPQLYQLNLSSGNIQRLTFNGGYNARGTFTPDGKSIVMIHRAGGARYGIAQQDVSSGNLLVLSESGFDTSPSMAPNGKLVLYETSPNQQGVLGIVSLDGRIKLQLPAQQGSVEDPAWSPFLS